MKTKKTVFVYVCTRRGFELFSTIRSEFPKLAAVTICVSTSANAMRVVPKTGKVIALTSNFFHSNIEIAADGCPEDEMTGAKLASLIKQKNLNAAVYLLSEYTALEPVFDGIFKRNVRTGEPTQELKKFLQELEENL